MKTTTDAELFGLIVSGPVRAVHTNEDGSWTVVPQVGAPLLLTGPAEAAAYVQRATASTGAAALAPATAPAPPAYDEAPQQGCGCVPALRYRSPQQEADMMQARAITAALGDLGIAPARRSAAYDDEHQAAAVRVASDHGIYALHIPPAHRQYAVTRNGQRDGVIGARRVPAVRDSMVATLLAAYLRDRGAL